MGISLAQRVLHSLGIKSESVLELTLPIQPLLAVFAAGVVATMIGPNLYRPYSVVLAYTKAKFLHAVIVELQPLTFTHYRHFLELFTARELTRVSARIVLLLWMAASVVDFSSRGLNRAISNDFPVNAINYLRHNPVPGPLYNNLNWGGFLMWYLAELPISIDGRNDPYGGMLDEHFYDTQSAFPSYPTAPYLDEWGVVVLDSTLPLAKVLTIDPRFRLIYQDRIATVFARR